MAASKELYVEIVAPDQSVWSGSASMVRARTTEGDLGILPGHQPMLAVLGEGELQLSLAGSQRESFHVAGGFMSVEGEEGRVIIAADEIRSVETTSPRSH